MLLPLINLQLVIKPFCEAAFLLSFVTKRFAKKNQFQRVLIILLVQPRLLTEIFGGGAF